MNAWTLPNVLTASRLVVVPFLFVAAARGSVPWFAGLFFWALLSDVLDGLVARWRQQFSPLGGVLDSIADAVLYLTVPFAAMLLYPWLWAREWGTVVAIFASYALPVAWGFLKFRRLTSYHTTGARIAAWVLSVSFFGMIVFGTAWPLRLAAVVLAVSQLEEIAITTVLREWRPDIPSLRHALQLKARLA